ncbi:hypothetical protein [Paenibacillus rubinfantis]|uniref:hypothetical protein n=1 Tax=Paenibacillus rubinfantis TaxID=1720296 RepID=UPI00073F5DD9|nr:hypothetical protein [Paenibacillus rubinfantis]
MFMDDLQAEIENDYLKTLKVYGKDGKVLLSLSNIHRIVPPRFPNTKTFDTIEEVMAFIRKEREYFRHSMHQYFLLHAYEIVDEHYIRIYYNVHSSNS